MSVYDLLGNKIQARIRKIKSNQFAIDLSGQRQGFYFVRIQNDQSVITKRITLLSDTN
ncbi:MAG: T9SS type A sorting domain-containing protein [Bacteroidetes bacterium]|nr:T9SS type A sorting domain-containing protein [Bacteroidota bacterium]